MMKKWKIVCMILAAVLALALAASGGTAVYFVRQAQQWHDACLSLRGQLRQRLEESCLSVTENGDAVGEFPLAGLRADDPYAQIDEMFSETDRLTAEQFAALSWTEQLGWYRRSTREAPAAWYEALQSGNTLTLALSDGGWDFAPVLAALDETPREAAQDAYAVFSAEKGAYEIVSEQPGTELMTEPIEQALFAAVSGVRVSPDSADSRSFELTSCDCYQKPALTAEAAVFDYGALLAADAAGRMIEVNFSGQTQSLSVGNYVFADADGRVQVDGEKLSQRLQEFAAQYNEMDTPFRFDSTDRGTVEIEFLPCNYTLNTAELYAKLEKQLSHLDTTPVEAQFVCTDLQGEPFGLGDTYIAVDIESQTVTYYQDGERLVYNDVVTGLPYGFATPTGLYHVVSLERDCWLTGPDFNVFVKYWVGFIGTLYGLHDASWRSEFGGERYKTNGSHGCVNMPDAPIRAIYENVQVGTPVLVF